MKIHLNIFPIFSGLELSLEIGNSEGSGVSGSSAIIVSSLNSIPARVLAALSLSQFSLQAVSDSTFKVQVVSRSSRLVSCNCLNLDWILTTKVIDIVLKLAA